MSFKVLPKEFYLSDNVLKISKALLGKYIVTNINQVVTSGMIVETEAYKGVEDKASHAYLARRTSRTNTMFMEGGIAYIYLCYGIHHLLNIVTAELDNPHAVLIRAIQPEDGLSEMLRRRKMNRVQYALTSGPGKLTQALGITTQFDGCPLNKAPLWLEDRGIVINNRQIISSPRVGIDYAQEHSLLPWRFRIKNNPWAGK